MTVAYASGTKRNSGRTSNRRRCVEIVFSIVHSLISPFKKKSSEVLAIFLLVLYEYSGDDDLLCIDVQREWIVLMFCLAFMTSDNDVTNGFGFGRNTKHVFFYLHFLSSLFFFWFWFFFVLVFFLCVEFAFFHSSVSGC